MVKQEKEGWGAKVIDRMSKDLKTRDGRVNPKRRQREAGRQTMQTGTGTRARQALQLQWEERKTERRQVGREQKEAEKQRMFELKQQKRKEKHRGR